MKRGYIIFVLGCIVGMVIQQFVFKNEMGIVEYVMFISILIIFSIERVWDMFMFLLLSSYMIVLPFSILYGSYNWYDPLILLYMFIALYNSVFLENKVNNPLMVEKGDILRFPLVNEI